MQRVLVVVFAAVMLAACSKAAPEVAVNDQVPADQQTQAASASEGAGGGEGGGGAPTWVAVDIDFASAPETATAGAEIALENQGQTVHNVTIDDEVIVEAQAGQTATAPLELEPGTYEFVCSSPGHETLMKGTVEVTE